MDDLITSMSAVSLSSISELMGKILMTFVHAAVVTFQRDSIAREEVPKFDEAEEDGTVWQTFDDFVNAVPRGTSKQPVTISTDVKHVFAGLFAGVAGLINRVGKLPAAPVAHLKESGVEGATIIALMSSVVTQGAHLLRADPICRELNYPHALRVKLETLVESKAFIDPGADEIVRLFLGFLKVVAWHAAAHAYERDRLTFNRSELLCTIASMGSTIPEDGVVREVLSIVRTSLGTWDMTVAAAKDAAAAAKAAAAAAAPKAAPKAAPAAAVAAAAAPKAAPAAAVAAAAAPKAAPTAAVAAAAPRAAPAAAVAAAAPRVAPAAAVAAAAAAPKAAAAPAMPVTPATPPRPAPVAAPMSAVVLDYTEGYPTDDDPVADFEWGAPARQ